MASDVSEARQALRDLARDPIPTSCVSIELGREEGESEDRVRVVLGARGAAAGEAFMAAQAALTVAEELRAEGEKPVTDKVEITPGHLIPFPTDVAYRRAQCDAADRIEAAVLKALQS